MSRGRARLLGVGVMLALVAIWVVPVADSLASAWPFAPTSIQWRYLTMSGLAPTVMSDLLAIGGVTSLTWVLGWRDALRTVAVVTLALCVMALLGTGMHVMDFLQLRKAVPLAARDRFNLGMIRWIVEVLLATAVLTVLGLGAIRASRTLKGSIKEKEKEILVRGR